MALSVVVLAAGKGKRMNSSLPKVLNPLAGRPMLEHVLTTACSLTGAEVHVVVGHDAEKVRFRFVEWPVGWVLQEEQLGTGHAVNAALNAIAEQSRVLVLYGDVPLIRRETLSSFLDSVPHDAVGVLTVSLNEPTGFGRIVRNEQGQIQKIVEEKDANPSEKQITEVNTGIMVVPAQLLGQWLPCLSQSNAQNEYYLTDVIHLAVADGVPVHAVNSVAEEVQGVNNKRQLVELERSFQRQQAYALIEKGVTIIDPNRFDLRGQIEVGVDTEIDVNVVLEGSIKLGNGVKIGPNVMLRDVQIGDNVEVKANSVIEEAKIEADAVVGPFARVRPGTVLHQGARVGNFVEIKNTTIGQFSKVNHLSYVGDANLGERVNIGAGTITCNYDGANKHQTDVQDDVFIGSGCQLVAPVSVAKGATVGAGSTITHPVPENSLAVARSRQKDITGWVRPTKASAEGSTTPSKKT